MKITGRRKKLKASTVLIYVIIIMLMVITIYPMWYVFVSSISNPTIAAQSGGIMLWPVQIQWEGFQYVLSDKYIWSGYLNTIINTVIATALNIVLTAGLAYPLSKKKLMLCKPLTLFVMFTMFFNGGTIPTYLVMKSLGLLNTRAAVILPGLVWVFNFIIMRTNFESIPQSLEESAYLDGASDWTIFWKIALPLSKTTIAMLVMFYGLNHWNSWYNEMLYLRDKTLWPLALVIRDTLINSETGASAEAGSITAETVENIKYCTIVVATIPLLCAYPFLQKYFVRGQLAGAVKE